jgi:two-component system cell cycle response regulator DivK
VPYKILVVEDNPDCRDLVVIQLKRLGYIPIEAASGEAGIEKAALEMPHLIIMDLGLPGISGLEAAGRLKADPITKHIPIIAHTAFEEDRYRNQVTKAGILALVPKPAPPGLLQLTIERYLQKV